MDLDSQIFEEHRASLLALAYRMLGDMGRAEDVVQEGWVRWQARNVKVNSPKAFLATVVTRLCLDELGSARARREEARSDRLPEPVDFVATGVERMVKLEQISMAFLVLLQRLTPAERAVLLLHEVFDLDHEEIGTLLGRSGAASRQLLKRARDSIAQEKGSFKVEDGEHERLFASFVRAIATGDHDSIFGELAENAVLIVDPGPGEQRFGRLRNVGRPVVGRLRVSSLIMSFVQQVPSKELEFVQRTLNGQPALVTLRGGRAMSAMLLEVANGKVQRVFFQNDPERLGHLGLD
jgi:RNA polymerase sigma-70 factor, ECF subfamily